MEILVALITAAGVILAAVVPALLSLRRTAGAVVAEGETTRGAVAEAMAEVRARVDARIDDVRDDIDGVREDVTRVREDVARVREWQAGHDAEHLLIGQQSPPRGDH
ncbi:hypothetical protein J3S85_37845 [Streptomyces lavenduligriseus]|nr:hypothetical protein J3S85_37845 [Streptomyces lavenduligriseus]